MTLRLGSTGSNVRAIQTFLNLTVDGNFGPRTEAAVRQWQGNNGLTPDGIVGPRTWALMGLATTDISEKNSPKSINIIKNFLPNTEYFAGPTKKSWLFLHHTAGWENPYNTISAWGRDDRGSVATEFVIGGQRITDNNKTHDGVILQAFPTGGYGWHLGTGNNVMHRNSVGIEVCNFGWVRDGRTYVNGVAHPSQIVTLSKPFRGYSTWHKYSDEQIKSLKELIIFIGNRDSIDVRKGLPELIRRLGVDAFDFFDVKFVESNPGLWNHTSVRKDKVDMFPQQELIDMLLSL